jgi:hypothetical protein
LVDVQPFRSGYLPPSALVARASQIASSLPITHEVRKWSVDALLNE